MNINLTCVDCIQRWNVVRFKTVHVSFKIGLTVEIKSTFEPSAGSLESKQDSLKSWAILDSHSVHETWRGLRFCTSKRLCTLRHQPNENLLTHIGLAGGWKNTYSISKLTHTGLKLTRYGRVLVLKLGPVLTQQVPRLSSVQTQDKIRPSDSPLSSEDTKYTLWIGWNFGYPPREFKLSRPGSSVLGQIFSYIRLVLNPTASINYCYYTILILHHHWVSSNENIPLARCNTPSVTTVMDEMLQLRATPATWKFGLRRNWNFVNRKIVFSYERWILIEF